MLNGQTLPNRLNLSWGRAIPLLVCLILFNSCVSTPLSKKQRGQTLYDRVMASGKIRCAYLIYPPLCMKDPNSGKISGIGIEAIEQVADKLGLTVEMTEEVGCANMIEGLKANRYDVMAGTVWPNANRAKQVAFSKPLCYSPIFAYARKGDPRFAGHLEAINSSDVKISTIDGETGEVIADADFPKAKRLSMPQLTDFSQNFLNVASGKADIVLAEPDLALRFLRNNPGTVENLNDSKPVRIFPNCWMFNRGEIEFKAMLDTVLDELINSGAMDKIINKYEPVPSVIYPVAPQYQNQAQSRLSAH
jgi:ABC-type amino acid transport substrate-binding protein